MEFVFACVEICNSVGVLSKSRQQLALTPLQVITGVSMLTMEFLPKVHKGRCSHSLEAWTLQGLNCPTSIQQYVHLELVFGNGRFCFLLNGLIVMLASQHAQTYIQCT